MFLVKVNITEQVSPDDFERIWKEKLFEDSTTLKEVNDWVCSKLYPYHSPSHKEMTGNIYLSKPEK